MKKLQLAFILSLFGILSFAQIEGKWKTIDDETGKPKSIVQIFKKSDGKYYGKVIQLLIKPAEPTCSKCKGNLKDQPILGMQVLEGLSKDGDQYSGGKITNPKNGKEYKCTVKLDGTSKLVVRGYVGIPTFGKTQVWLKEN